MSAIRRDLVNAAKRRVINLIYHDDIDKEHELRMQNVLADKSLTSNEKSEVIESLTQIYDDNKITYNEGIRGVCGDCKQECFATSFCELCVRNYLKANFSNWTSGNNEIDNLIQECQMKTLLPYKIMDTIQ